MIIASFNLRKAAQVVAFFARENGGAINVLKLMKLVYLADRESMKLYDGPILFDQMVSMDHGPVNSATYNLVNGMGAESTGWDDFVGGRRGHDVVLARPVTNEDLDELSRRDLRVLASVWKEFRHMGKYEIRDYTHAHCLEWEDPHGSSAPIPYDRIFKFLGKVNAQALAERIEENQNLSALLTRHSGDQTRDVDAF
jgi:uncharacterized phage-associated protein